MSRKFYQTESFYTIANQWEKILADSGFIDAEKSIRGERVLKQSALNVYRQMEATRREAKGVYFNELSSCMHYASFDNDLHELVMRLKAQGDKISEICETLLWVGMARYRKTVARIIRIYEERWGIRRWSPEELKYRPKRRQATR